MKDWIDIVRAKVLEEKDDLPPEDWDMFEARYLNKKKYYWIIPLSVASAVFAALAIIIFINIRPEDQTPLAASAPWVEHKTHTTRQEKKEETFIASSRTYDAATVQSENIVNEDNDEKDIHNEEIIDNHNSDREAEILFEKEDIDTINTSEDNVVLRSDRRLRLTLAPYFGGIQNNGIDRIPANHSSSLSHYSDAQFKSGYLTIGETPLDYNSLVFSHSIPISIGLDVSVGLNDRFSLTTGLELSQYSSRISTIDQKAIYLGIPLRVDYTLLNVSRFSSWLGIGGKVDYMIFGILGKERLFDKSLYWSLLSNVGVQYDFMKNIGVFISPSISYCFQPPEPKVITYRTEKPWMFNLSAGLKFSL